MLFRSEAGSLFEDNGPPVGLGHVIIALDPVRIGGVSTTARMAEMAIRVADEPGARLPGRRGQTARRRAIEEGIEIEDDVLAAIAEL